MGRIGEMMDRRREAENVVMHTHQVLSWEKIRFLPNKQTKSQKSENEASLPGVVPCNFGGKGHLCKNMYYIRNFNQKIDNRYYIKWVTVLMQFAYICITPFELLESVFLFSMKFHSFQRFP